MSMTKRVATLEERINSQKDQLLRDNGWNYKMWRCFWVWQKDSGDAMFICFDINEAIKVESLLQQTDRTYGQRIGREAATEEKTQPALYGILCVQEADCEPHVHPVHGPGLFFAEDAIIATKGAPAWAATSPAQSAVADAKDAP